MERRVLCHEVYLSAYRVAVHVGGDDLVYLYGLNHVGWYEVELHVACVAFCRRNPVAVDGHRGQVGARAAHLSEARFALVVLHIDAAYALEGVTYV